MSTRPYHPDDLVTVMACLLLRDAPHQRDLYADLGATAEHVHAYCEAAGYTAMANAFLAANARAVAVAYREETFTLEWTPAQSAAVARLVRVGGLDAATLGKAMIDVRLLRYNLDGEATVEALDFVIRAALEVNVLTARPDVLREAEK